MTGVWPAASMPLVAADRVSTAIAKARGVVSGFLTARPGLAHSLPEDAEGRGGAWPSPRTWEMVLRLLATGGAAGASPEAISAAVVGAIGDGAGLELLSYMEQLDLPDPNRVLADPKAFALPERGDRQLAFLTAVVSAVRSEPTRRRWEAGWQVLAKAVEAGVPDVAARAATDLATMRDPAWPVPEDIDAFVQQAADARATVTSQPEDMFWGDRFGTISDPFGHVWSVATHVEELKASGFVRDELLASGVEATVAPAEPATA
jgi:hypothetical protein